MQLKISFNMFSGLGARLVVNWRTPVPAWWLYIGNLQLKLIAIFYACSSEVQVPLMAIYLLQPVQVQDKPIKISTLVSKLRFFNSILSKSQW
jgi:hypothetical protein